MLWSPSKWPQIEAKVETPFKFKDLCFQTGLYAYFEGKGVFRALTNQNRTSAGSRPGSCRSERPLLPSTSTIGQRLRGCSRAAANLPSITGSTDHEAHSLSVPRA